MDYDIGKAFAAIEEELIASMMRNMKRHREWETDEGFEWGMWQAEQLKALDKYKRTNKKKFERQFNEINGSIRMLIERARAEGGMEQELEILEAIEKGWKPPRMPQNHLDISGEFFKLNTRKLEALIKATENDFQRAETAMLRMANDQYRQVIFNAQVYANTGAGTYEKAVDMATKDFLSRGINCIEYSNGARHTMRDYAEMAIRTAAKRAYLTGEGEKRQEWGIDTVIVHKRGNPCPKCLPFVGKVLIDDVWSGGSSEPGQKYPLMSTAVSAGLYHPRCLDTHSTYFPGISATPDDSFTREEIEEIKNNYRLKQKRMFAKRQSDKYSTLAKMSLDIKEKERYKHIANQWKNKTYDANMFRTYEDPIREKMGSAFKSHPSETLGIIELLEAKGVKIEYRDNVMGYQPNPTSGKAGRFVIDKKASYSAWLHELQHVLDDEESGWLGFRNFIDTETAVKFESNAYDVEIDFAEQLGYNDIVKRLKALKDKRIKELRRHDDY